MDEQHRRLADIINRIGEVLIDGNATDDSFSKIFGELAQYATYHFADEERLMAQAGIASRHINLHRQHHQQFVAQLTSMWKGRAE